MMKMGKCRYHGEKNPDNFSRIHTSPREKRPTSVFFGSSNEGSAETSPNIPASSSSSSSWASAAGVVGPGLVGGRDLDVETSDPPPEPTISVGEELLLTPGDAGDARPEEFCSLESLKEDSGDEVDVAFDDDDDAADVDVVSVDVAAVVVVVVVKAADDVVVDDRPGGVARRVESDLSSNRFVLASRAEVGEAVVVVTSSPSFLVVVVIFFPSPCESLSSFLVRFSKDFFLDRKNVEMGLDEEEEEEESAFAAGEDPPMSLDLLPCLLFPSVSTTLFPLHFVVFSSQFAGDACF